VELILIEGLPGSGKSAMAEKICEAAQVSGINSSWYLEESKVHPVHPADFKHDRHDKNYPERCLKQWAKFVSEKNHQDRLFIIEGSLFQSTVRLMLEGKNKELIADYYSECQLILSSVHPKLIYLRPIDARTHIEWTMEHRGEEWTSKVAEYLEKTPYCSEQQWQGEKCMVSFWSEYVQLCDSLISQTSMTYHTINAGYGNFESQFNKAMSHVNSEKWLSTALYRKETKCTHFLI
jgi:hypothetical protein